MSSTKNVGVLIFNDVEVMDFCGPFEVFSVADRTNDNNPFNVFTVAEGEGPIYSKNNLSINPKYTINNCPNLDILIIPGGQGSRIEMNNEIILNWIKLNYPNLELLLTVCTGALIAAKCGLLNNMSATTHHLSLELLKENAPNTKVIFGERYVDNGKIILSAGVSAGIDMSLYVVEKLLGKEAVMRVRDAMEYGDNFVE